MSYVYVSSDSEKTRQSLRDQAVFELSCKIEEPHRGHPAEFDRAVASLLHVDRLAPCSSLPWNTRKYSYRLGPFSTDTLVNFLTGRLTQRGEGHPDLYHGSMNICDVIGRESQLYAKLVAAVDDIYKQDSEGVYLHMSDVCRDAASAFHAEEERLYSSSIFMHCPSAVAVQNEGMVVIENGDDIISMEVYPALLQALLSCSRSVRSRRGLTKS